MHARVTRYEGSSETIDEALETKRRVLPTALGQTEGMKGAIFLADRDAGTVIVISLWEDEQAMAASEAAADRVREEVATEGETTTAEHYEVAYLAFEQAPATG